MIVASVDEVKVRIKSQIRWREICGVESLGFGRDQGVVSTMLWYSGGHPVCEMAIYHNTDHNTDQNIERTLRRSMKYISTENTQQSPVH